jgi:hypothetical protein
MELLVDDVSFISSVAPVIVNFGVASMSIIDLEIGFRTTEVTERIEPTVGECERSQELGLGEE